MRPPNTCETITRKTQENSGPAILRRLPKQASAIGLFLHNDQPESESCFTKFQSSSVLGGLKALDSRVRRKGLASLDASRGALIPMGMDVERGRAVVSISLRDLKDASLRALDEFLRQAAKYAQARR